MGGAVTGRRYTVWIADSAFAGLGNISHFDCHFAGVHFHGPDNCLPGYGTPGTSLNNFINFTF
jgi:hypothetical protein